jgi:hypothetical protein
MHIINTDLEATGDIGPGGGGCTCPRFGNRRGAVGKEGLNLPSGKMTTEDADAGSC